MLNVLHLGLTLSSVRSLGPYNEGFILNVANQLFGGPDGGISYTSNFITP